jgi:hypothetical protein
MYQFFERRMPVRLLLSLELIVEGAARQPDYPQEVRQRKSALEFGDD